MTVRVSMVIAVLNGEKFIAKAVRSALTQTIDDVEVLVADNGSTDGTWGILEALAADDQRVRPLRATSGRGAGVARNACLAAARGDWLAVLDADDYMHPSRLERLLDFADERGAQLVADNQLLVDPEGRPLHLAWPQKDFPPQVDAANYVLANSDGRRGQAFAYLKPVFRRDLIEANGLRYPEIHLGEDYQFLFDLLRPGTVLHLYAEPLYYYVQIPGSLSRTFCESDLLLWLETNQSALAACSVGDERLRDALVRQRNGMLHQLTHTAFVQAIKAGRFGRALFEVLREPSALPLISHYALEGMIKRLNRLALKSRPLAEPPADEHKAI